MNNLKRAFFESDVAYVEGRADDDAFPAICKALDVAATLRLSLKTPLASWKAPNTKRGHKDRFIDFLALSIPCADRSSPGFELIDSRTHQVEKYNLVKIDYAVRCMIHENENLNAEEAPDYHVLLDWNQSKHNQVLGSICDGRVTCNAQVIWWRIREVVAGFIIGTEFQMAFERGDRSLVMTCEPELKSIFPGDGRHRTNTGILDSRNQSNS
jgi:hypothetical protein